jgi:hypothetical protein
MRVRVAKERLFCLWDRLSLLRTLLEGLLKRGTVYVKEFDAHVEHSWQSGVLVPFGSCGTGSGATFGADDDRHDCRHGGRSR